MAIPRMTTIDVVFAARSRIFTFRGSVAWNSFGEKGLDFLHRGPVSRRHVRSQDFSRRLEDFAFKDALRAPDVGRTSSDDDLFRGPALFAQRRQLFADVRIEQKGDHQ